MNTIEKIFLMLMFLIFMQNLYNYLLFLVYLCAYKYPFRLIHVLILNLVFQMNVLVLLVYINHEISTQACKYAFIVIILVSNC